MPRGGPRTGTTGNQYPNRSDLRQPVTVTKAQQYGDRQQAMSAQQDIPLPKRVGEQITGQTQDGSQQASDGAPSDIPAGIPSGLGYHDPTNRPNEPVTAGLSTGMGESPNPALHWTDPDMIAVRSLYQMHPSEDLRRLIEKWGS